MNKSQTKRSITSKHFYKIAEAQQISMDSHTVFIIANELLKTNKEVGRYYTVFSSFKEFLLKRDKYPHCHELFLDHINNKPNIAGRLVFDFDIKNTPVPSKFKSQIENTVFEVINKYFRDIDESRLEFVWSTSKNPTKFSKHLTVKNLYFDNWMGLSKVFYNLFCIEWDNGSYDWISSKDLIDFQIVRNRASLRMVGSSKINGCPLIMDDPRFSLTDSLIRIYLKSHRQTEQLITRQNIIPEVFTNVLTGGRVAIDPNSDPNSDPHFDRSLDGLSAQISSSIKSVEIDPIYDRVIYYKAFCMCDILKPGVFKMGKVNGNILSLLRLRPDKCLLSDRVHEQENAYIRIIDDEDHYIVRFGCYRSCSKYKSKIIGYISTGSKQITYDPVFETYNNNIGQIEKAAKEMITRSESKTKSKTESKTKSQNKVMVVTAKLSKPTPKKKVYIIDI